jgi:predicted DNA-binding transcriptional regulator AlpA
MSDAPDRLLRTPEAAVFLGIAKSTLEKMRVRGDGPPYFSVGPRVVVYDRRVIAAWLASRTRHSTSDNPEAA